MLICDQTRWSKFLYVYQDVIKWSYTKISKYKIALWLSNKTVAFINSFVIIKKYHYFCRTNSPDKEWNYHPIPLSNSSFAWKRTPSSVPFATKVPKSVVTLVNTFEPFIWRLKSIHVHIVVRFSHKRAVAIFMRRGVRPDRLCKNAYWNKSRRRQIGKGRLKVIEHINI